MKQVFICSFYFYLLIIVTNTDIIIPLYIVGYCSSLSTKYTVLLSLRVQLWFRNGVWFGVDAFLSNDCYFRCNQAVVFYAVRLLAACGEIKFSWCCKLVKVVSHSNKSMVGFMYTFLIFLSSTLQMFVGIYGESTFHIVKIIVKHYIRETTIEL